jgi:hypothetical protein
LGIQEPSSLFDELKKQDDEVEEKEKKSTIKKMVACEAFSGIMTGKILKAPTLDYVPPKETIQRLIQRATKDKDKLLI